MSKKVLLTGSEGYVASVLRESLKETDVRFITFDGMEDVYRMINEVTPLIPTVDVIVHLGGDSNPQNPTTPYLFNTIFSAALLLQAANSRIPCLSFSSGSAADYGSQEIPMTPYSESKLLTEVFNDSTSLQWMLRPGVIWGDEKARTPERRSLPWRILYDPSVIAFRDWRRYYAHISTIVSVITDFIREGEFADFSPGIYAVLDPELVNSDLIVDRVEERLAKVITRANASEMQEFPVLSQSRPSVPIIRTCDFWYHFHQYLSQEVE